ncbi:hypothetical protein QJS10_CPA08g00635 [Acorus calamus]|uniref:Plastocyanin-like domain-containing protein n=1 Tax=Acorus calamus TaxID=4465 RepID=A0AAV9EDB5_ACOCL|nr:hypothetical protein QJS10_CPA08g00635 [Acorus calamus]
MSMVPEIRRWEETRMPVRSERRRLRVLPEMEGEEKKERHRVWYHDHALGLTRANLLAGLIGAYNIHNDDVETPFDLPCDEYDRHLVIVDRSFNVDGSLYMNSTGNNPTIHPEWQPEYFGEAIIVNGKAWPYLTVKPQRVF